MKYIKKGYNHNGGFQKGYKVIRLKEHDIKRMELNDLRGKLK